MVRLRCVCVLSRFQLLGHHVLLPTGSSVHGYTQASKLEWAAISFTRGYSWSRDRTPIAYIAGGFFTGWATRDIYLSNEELFKRLTSGGSLALQFVYSVTRQGCFIWKQWSFLAIKERKHVFHRCSTEKRRKMTDFHCLSINWFYSPLLSACGQGFWES